jgi:hypothetical protein
LAYKITKPPTPWPDRYPPEILGYRTHQLLRIHLRRIVRHRRRFIHAEGKANRQTRAPGRIRTDLPHVPHVPHVPHGAQLNPKVVGINRRLKGGQAGRPQPARHRAAQRVQRKLGGEARHIPLQVCGRPRQVDVQAAQAGALSAGLREGHCRAGRHDCRRPAQGEHAWADAEQGGRADGRFLGERERLAWVFDAIQARGETGFGGHQGCREGRRFALGRRGCRRRGQWVGRSAGATATGRVGERERERWGC